MDMTPWIIRNGNHFIYLDGAGWVLIDGPWFDRLPADSTLGIYYVPAYFSVPVTYTEGPPIASKFDTILWQRIQWVPGYRTMSDPYLSWKYHNLVGYHRYKPGWRICPDGRLPILFNALDWQPEMEFDYTL